MSFKSESQLQELLIKVLQAETILELINGQEEIDGHLSRDTNARFIPGFQIDFQLRTLYCRKAKKALGSLSLYDIITGERIKNISLQKDTPDKRERIYPDVLISSPEQKTFSIIELKKDAQTEREAITELFAYAIELKNQLPSIADSDINLIIISTEFNTLLDHSLSSIVLGTKFNILALKAGLKEDRLTLDLYFPDSWTDIWQNSLPPYAFSSVTMVPYKHEENKEIPDKALLFDIIEDLITFTASKNNSHGFYIIWRNLSELDNEVEFCISLYQINPFVFLQSSIEKNFTLNTNQPLSQYITENFQDNLYYQSDSLMNIGSEVKIFLDRYFNTQYEDFSSWTDHMCLGSHFRSQAFPILFNSWGNIGDYIRYYFFHPSLKNGFFSDEQLNAPFFYKNPAFGIELINRISGRTLFEDGVYNFSSLFSYAKQLRELLNISAWYLNDKREKKRFVLLKPRLFYAALDVIASAREIQYRSNSIALELKPPANSLEIKLYDVNDNVQENIKETVQWFVDEFLNKNPVHQEFFVGAINWTELFMNERLSKEDAFEIEIRNQLITYVKTHLFCIIHDEIISKSSFFNDKLFNLLEPYFTSIDDIKVQTEDQKLLEIIESIDENLILSLFESTFLLILDLVYCEVFHPLIEFNDLNFITKDWKKLQIQLTKRFNEGHKYGTIILDSNGNLGVGIMPKEFHLLKPIEDPEKEVFILMNNSGIITAKRSNWEEVKSGAAFKNKH